MGTYNVIAIPKLGIKVYTKNDDLLDIEFERLHKILTGQVYYDMDEVKVDDAKFIGHAITLIQLVNSLELGIDTALIYWLKAHDVEYEIYPEYDEEKKKKYESLKLVETW